MNFSADAKRVLFEALVVAHAANERTVSPERIVSAVLHSDAAVDLFRADLSDAITPLGAPLYSHLLKIINANLSENGITFGSQPHIASIHPLPIDEATQRALIEMNASDHDVTQLHILLAVLERQEQIAELLAARDITPQSIRAAIDKTKGA